MVAWQQNQITGRRSIDDCHNRDLHFGHPISQKKGVTSVIPIIEGDIRDAKCVSGGIPSKNLDYLTDDTLVPGNAEIYYGARPERLDRRVRDELSGHVIPSKQDDLPIAPNLFLEVK